MNFVIEFIQSNLFTVCVFLFVFSLFLIFSIFKEWMIITKLTVFYLLNLLLIGILFMKSKIPIVLNITTDEIMQTHIIFTVF